MSMSDGTNFVHGPSRPGQWKKTTHYDQIWKALEGTELRMIGDHSTPGGLFRIVDRNQIKVGEVSFDSRDSFLGGQFYGDMIVKGRTNNANTAVADFVARIEETHASRRR